MVPDHRSFNAINLVFCFCSDFTFDPHYFDTDCDSLYSNFILSLIVLMANIIIVKNDN